ncbi:acyl carrier protein, mitochondrial [Monosporozyma unispora]
MLRSVLRVASLRVSSPSSAMAMKSGAIVGSRMIHYSMSNRTPGAQFQKLQPIRFYSAAASNLSKDDVLTRVKDVIKTFNKNTDAEKISLETAFNKDLGLDSLDTVELLVAVEEEFEIEIPDKIADDLKTVGETVEYILSNPESN